MSLLDMHASLNCRLDVAEIRQQYAQVNERIDIFLLENMPVMVLILNQCQQAVYGNSTVLQALGLKSVESLWGMRPGELFNCVNAELTISGCGTSEYCGQCGALRACLGARTGCSNDQDARLLSKTENRLQAMNLHIHAVPMRVDGQPFLILYAQDVAATFEKDMLERVFFHDMVNALGGIIGIANLIQDEASDDIGKLAEIVVERAQYLTREITAHKMLQSAEQSSLALDPVSIDPHELCENLRQMFLGGQFKDKTICCVPQRGQGLFVTDKRILYRILENLIKNALEATAKGGTVAFGMEFKDAAVIFNVHNDEVIDPAVQQQIFQRSFSTKGKGRGLGTYSVKLFVENYLQGRVWFRSEAGLGTDFYVQLPAVLRSGL